MKDTSLKALREKIESQMEIKFSEDETIVTECIGICSSEN